MFGEIGLATGLGDRLPFESVHARKTTNRDLVEFDRFDVIGSAAKDGVKVGAATPELVPQKIDVHQPTIAHALPRVKPPWHGD